MSDEHSAESGAGEQRMFLAADIRDQLAESHPGMGFGERNRIAWDTGVTVVVSASTFDPARSVLAALSDPGPRRNHRGGDDARA